MRKHVLTGAAGLVGVGLVVIGLQFLLAPEASADGYGVPANAAGDAGPYLAVKGVRDLTFGLVTLALLVAGERRSLAVLLLVATVAPLGDAVIVLANDGSAAEALGIHGVTAVAMAIIGSLLLRSAPPRGPEPQLAGT